jgi:2-dehydropantoate 2-reductase
MKTRFLVCGAGAIGGYFGGRLAQNPHNEVTFLSRGQTYRNLVENGLTIKSIHGDFNIKVNTIEDPGKLNPLFDFIFICVKLYDNSELFKSIKHLFKQDVITVTLQNGLSGYEELKNYIPDRNNLLQGICKISSEMKSDGIIYHTALGKLITGEYQGYGKKASMKLVKLFSDSAVKIIISDDFKQDIWIKYAWNAIFNSLTALYMISADELFNDENYRLQVFKLYEAFSEIAETQGVIFGGKEYKMIITDTMNLEKFQTSAYFDRRNGKKTEVPYFLTYLKTLAVKYNLENNYLIEFSKIIEKEGL